LATFLQTRHRSYAAEPCHRRFRDFSRLFSPANCRSTSNICYRIREVRIRASKWLWWANPPPDFCLSCHGCRGSVALPDVISHAICFAGSRASHESRLLTPYIWIVLSPRWGLDALVHGTTVSPGAIKGSDKGRAILEMSSHLRRLREASLYRNLIVLKKAGMILRRRQGLGQIGWHSQKRCKTVVCWLANT